MIQFDSADEFVVSAFEKWRQELELDSFHLAAHSMGVRLESIAFDWQPSDLTSSLSLQAIFASSYALQHPQHIDVRDPYHPDLSTSITHALGWRCNSTSSWSRLPVLVTRLRRRIRPMPRLKRATTRGCGG